MAKQAKANVLRYFSLTKGEGGHEAAEQTEKANRFR